MSCLRPPFRQGRPAVVFADKVRIATDWPVAFNGGDALHLAGVRKHLNFAVEFIGEPAGRLRPVMEAVIVAHLRPMTSQALAVAMKEGDVGAVGVIVLRAPGASVGEDEGERFANEELTKFLDFNQPRPRRRRRSRLNFWRLLCWERLSVVWIDALRLGGGCTERGGG